MRNYASSKLDGGSSNSEPGVTVIKVIKRPHQIAQTGESRGEISLGNFDVWEFEGVAGDIFTIQLSSPTNPADDAPTAATN